MKALIVDDKRLAATNLADTLGRVMPGTVAECRYRAENALDALSGQDFDVAFLDIEMPGMDGLELARRAKEAQPGLNIVFVTGHPDYALEAHGLYPSGFLLKPATDQDIQEALDNLRTPLHITDQGLRVQCFGNFEVFYDGYPIHFDRSKSKELLAYLVDRQGALCTVGEIVGVLWGDDSVGKGKQIRNLIADCKASLTQVGASDVLVRYRGSVAIDVSAISCDYYDFLRADAQAVRKYRGEYMTQYSWAEFTCAQLSQRFLR